MIAVVERDGIEVEEIRANACFAQMFRYPARYYYTIGGRWAAKTYEVIQIIVMRLRAVPGSKACFMRKVYASIRDSIYENLITYLNDNNIPCAIRESPMLVRFPNGSRITFKGADNPEKLKGLGEIDIVLMEEANEFTEMDFETIDQGIRGRRQENSIYLNHNPVPKIAGSLYWFEKVFKFPATTGKPERYYDERLGSNVVVMRTTYKDNFHCPEHVRRRLEGYKDTNPALYRLWALGEYTEVRGVILKEWDIVEDFPRDDERNITQPLLGYGLDFGFSDDPAACVEVRGGRGEIWVKLLVYSTGLKNRELYDKLQGIDERAIVVADSAEPKTISELYDFGLRGIRGAKKRTNYKSEMANILQGYKIHLVKSPCIMDLQREFQTWAWDEDKTGKLLPRPKDGNDHAIDALIMFMHEHRGGMQMSVSFARK